MACFRSPSVPLALFLALLMILATAAAAQSTPQPAALTAARDAQNQLELQKLASTAAAAATKAAADPAAFYQSALAHLYLAEVALEKKDKKTSGTAAETGINAAKRAVELKPNDSEYRRILGTLCGQIIPANVLAGFKYGRCALDEINKAVELDAKSAANYLSRGVGNYYLPAQFGGSVDKAIEDFDRALKINPKLADALLWKGIALRKLNKNAEARQALEKSLALNPARLWTKEQLAKTPAQ